MSIKVALIWLAGGLFLVILAQYLPRVAVWLSVLLLASVLLMNSKKYIALSATLTNTIQGK